MCVLRGQEVMTPLGGGENGTLRAFHRAAHRDELRLLTFIDLERERITYGGSTVVCCWVLVELIYEIQRVNPLWSNSSNAATTLTSGAFASLAKKSQKANRQIRMGRITLRKQHLTCDVSPQ